MEEITEKSFEFVELNNELAAVGSLGVPELNADRTQELRDEIRECRAWFRDHQRALKPLFYQEMRRHHERVME